MKRAIPTKYRNVKNRLDQLVSSIYHEHKIATQYFRIFFNALASEGTMVMSGVVIAFPGKKVRINTKKARPSSRRHLKARVDRITLLLAELEDLTRPSADVSAVLTQARVSFREVEERLAGQGLAHSWRVTDEDCDSQPDLDRDVL